MKRIVDYSNWVFGLLILAFVTSCITGVSTLLMALQTHSYVFGIIYGLLLCAEVAALLMILQKKRLGLILWVVCLIIAILLKWYMIEKLDIIIPIGSVILLYAILQIRNDEVSAWDLLMRNGCVSISDDGIVDYEIEIGDTK